MKTNERMLKISLVSRSNRLEGWWTGAYRRKVKLRAFSQTTTGRVLLISSPKALLAIAPIRCSSCKRTRFYAIPSRQAACRFHTDHGAEYYVLSKHTPSLAHPHTAFASAISFCPVDRPSLGL